MKNFILICFIILFSFKTNANDLINCFEDSRNSIEFKNCIDETISSENEFNDLIAKNPIPDPGYDCSEYRNYRDRDGNFTCPTENYDACLVEYGPRLPPPYFGFVKQWCWCNCVFVPSEIE